MFQFSQFVDNPVFSIPEQNDLMKIKISNLAIPDININWYFQIRKKNVNKGSSFLTKEKEAELFLCMNWAKSYLCNLEKQSIYNKSSELQKEIQFYHNFVKKIEAVIVSANISMVVNIISKKFNNYDFDEFISAGNDALVTALRQFDISKGNRFTTYAYTAIRNALVNLSREHQNKDINFEDEKDDGKKHFDIVDSKTEDQNFLNDLKNIIDTNSAKLNDLEIKVLKMRYYEEDKCTYEEIGSRIGYSREWAKKVELGALSKIKATLTNMR